MALPMMSVHKSCTVLIKSPDQSGGVSGTPTIDSLPDFVAFHTEIDKHTWIDLTDPGEHFPEHINPNRLQIPELPIPPGEELT